MFAVLIMYFGTRIMLGRHSPSEAPGGLWLLQLPVLFMLQSFAGSVDLVSHARLLVGAPSVPRTIPVVQTSLSAKTWGPVIVSAC